MLRTFYATGPWPLMPTVTRTLIVLHTVLALILAGNSTLYVSGIGAGKAIWSQLWSLVCSTFHIMLLGTFGEQGWRSVESTPLPPMWPGFESWHWRHMLLSLLLLLSLAPRGFSPGTPVSPLHENQHFQIPIWSGTHRHVSTSSYELLSALWVNKLQFTVLVK